MADAEATYRLESHSAHALEREDRTFVGRRLKAEHGEERASVFLGVDREYVERVLSLSVDLPRSEDQHVEDEREKVSVFSDGTIFSLARQEQER